VEEVQQGKKKVHVTNFAICAGSKPW